MLMFDMIPLLAAPRGASGRATGAEVRTEDEGMGTGGTGGTGMGDKGIPVTWY